MSWGMARSSGRAAPAPEQRLLKSRPVTQTRAVRWPFTGREAELRLVEDALADAAAGGVVIVGPAGVGKTRLLGEAAARAEARGVPLAWVRATASARSIPLGAFAPLLPALEAREGVELLARARQALAGRGLLLCVDDGQLLDDASAALLHQLVAAGEVRAVVSVRRDDPAPDAVRALWKDDLCALVEVGELSRAEADGLLEAVLGGALDRESAHALWELTRGNALYLRELVRLGLDRGLLAPDGGIWRWRGELQVGSRLAELVDLRVGDAGASGRRVLELVAVGAPLELALLDPGELAAVQALEERELVARRDDGRRRLVDVAHPLHAEAVRAGLAANAPRGDPRPPGRRARRAGRAARGRPRAARRAPARGRRRSATRCCSARLPSRRWRRSTAPRRAAGPGRGGGRAELRRAARPGPGGGPQRPRRRGRGAARRAARRGRERRRAGRGRADVGP